MKARMLMIAALTIALGIAGCSEGNKMPADKKAADGGYYFAPAAEYAVQANMAEQEDFGTVHNTETYDHFEDNPFLNAKQNPLSTFSIDVDTASYANVRRYLTSSQLPPPGAVRIEELINYFTYDYPQPEGDVPFSVTVDAAECLWQTGHQLVRIGLKGRDVEGEQRPASNLVFLLDVSGSMQLANKLPLVKSAMKLLVDKLGANDRIAIVVYAGRSGLALPSTSANQKQVILSALDSLDAGGSTNGAEGIHLAYDVAMQNFINGGINRVVLCTDGDFNVGVTDQSQLVRLVEEKAAAGVFLSVLGFGMGNYKDSTMEKLADKGNGNYAYIDTINEARKVLVEQMSGTLVTIAKDVKIQIDFNPGIVGAYRLLGYENRMLRSEDFRDDKKDAGEIGAGHTVTALYEIVPAGSESQVASVEPSKYQAPAQTSEAPQSNELLTVRLRYKQPDANASQEFRLPLIVDKPTPFTEANEDFRFAAAVAEFGMQLRDSKHKGEASLKSVATIAQTSVGDDPSGYRAEFIRLVQMAEGLKR